MGKGKFAALAVGATALATGVIAAAAPAGTAAVKPTTASPASASSITNTAGVIHPMAVMSTPSQANCLKYGDYLCYTPQRVEAAYHLGSLYKHGITGKGQTIVIVDSFGSPTIAHDLNVFDKQFGLPAPPSFKIIAPAGKIPAWNSKDSDMTGWGGETTLDVEYAHTIAPGASILLVETPVSETEGVQGFPQIVRAEDYVIAHHLGGVISQSFSATEETFGNSPAQDLKTIDTDRLRRAYVAAAEQKNGPTVLAASGDSGVADVGLDGSTYYTYDVTSWPDSDPLVTGVGGTEIKEGGDHNYYQVAWNDTFDPKLGAGTVPYASGGGLSVLFTRPSYQNGVSSVVGDARGVPDVSMSGACSSPVFTYQSFPDQGTPAGWYPSCGTSEATPEFAGIVALADQVAGHPLGVINPRLYQLSAQQAPGIVPVTKGNNSVNFVQDGKTYKLTGFNAQAGYSLVDGVGTVNGWYLAYELAGKNPPK
ncbi:MAG TPA: S53 family peptidase [Trebonia sp.]|nr:S53 family peptidase [Trebonia sp.]